MPVFPSPPVTYPATGQWVDPSQVAVDGRLTNVVMPSGVTVASVVGLASMILFYRSGQRYNQSTRTERPCHLGAGCGNRVSMAGAMSSSGGGATLGGAWDGRWPEGWGCSHSVYEYVLPGNGPIAASSITVTVDGSVLIAQGQVGEQWHLYDGRRLVRVIDPTGPAAALGYWPCCQWLSRPLGQAGTWSVAYTHGTPIPPEATMAAYDLSVEMCLNYGTKSGKLPSNAIHAARQGVSVDLETVTASFQGPLPSRIANDWLAAVNPHGLTRPSTVTSIDRVRGFSG